MVKYRWQSDSSTFSRAHSGWFSCFYSFWVEKWKENTTHATEKALKNVWLSGCKKKWRDASKSWFSSACGCTGRVVFLSRAVNSETYHKDFGAKEKSSLLKARHLKKRVALNFALKAHNHCDKVSSFSFLIISGCLTYAWLSQIASQL